MQVPDDADTYAEMQIVGYDVKACFRSDFGSGLTGVSQVCGMRVDAPFRQQCFRRGVLLSMSTIPLQLKVYA